LKHDSAADPEGTRLPIKLDSTSNGEFVPVPLSPANRKANYLAREAAVLNAKRLGLTRRNFLVSVCGAASTLLAFNQANAAAGRSGGFFEIPKEAALDQVAARSTMDGKEFIFDVQGHYVNPEGAWLSKLPANARPLSGFPKVVACAPSQPQGGHGYLKCIGPDEFLKDVFMDSDTDMMVLSFVPSAPDAEPLTIQEADAVRRIVDRMEGSHRLMLHGRVNPNQAGDLERMDELAEKWKICAWKTYTQFGPGGKGYFLSEDAGTRFIEKARQTGVKIITVHKGLPFGKQSYEHSQCMDIGVVAKRFPDMTFIVYHSGFVTSQPELAYDHAAKRDGIDTLIRSLVENGVAPNSNVYAELGSTWRFLMRDPEAAAHGLGKLLKHCGENNVLWGTDSIWYGSPQDQIQAFRTFQISKELQQKHGYPAITPALREKIFGLNALKPYQVSAEEAKKRMRRDKIAREKGNYLERADPHFRTYGPKTRREFLNLVRLGGGGRG
jgi:predicted TIM-barrel fold metal-dependent hydrolase